VHYRFVFRFFSVGSALFGLAFLFYPNALMELYKAEPMNAPGVYNAMLYGAWLLAMAYVFWAGSRAPEISEARTPILAGLLAYGIGLVVVLIRQLTAANIPAAAWVNVGIFALGAAAFAYLQFAELPRSTRRTSAVHG
jgi:hypothetical protein